MILFSELLKGTVGIISSDPQFLDTTDSQQNPLSLSLCFVKKCGEVSGENRTRWHSGWDLFTFLPKPAVHFICITHINMKLSVVIWCLLCSLFLLVLIYWIKTSEEGVYWHYCREELCRRLVPLLSTWTEYRLSNI